MNIFILEDDPERNRLFKDKLGTKHMLTMTTTSDEAIEQLKVQKFDLLLLDHDLGGRQMVASSQYDTGFRVACEIPTTINQDTPTIVHSYNGGGALKMISVLTTDRKLYAPFNYNQFWMDIESMLKDK